jgi:hypothetical protein
MISSGFKPILYRGTEFVAAKKFNYARQESNLQPAD